MTSIIDFLKSNLPAVICGQKKKNNKCNETEKLSETIDMSWLRALLILSFTSGNVCYRNTSFRKYLQTRMVEPFARGECSFTRMRERTAKKIKV